MLGERLIFLRKSRGWTQEEISKKIGVHRGTYSNYEANKREPDYKTLKKIADIYDVTTDYLLGRENNEASIDIKEALENKKATWGGQELTPEQREILTEFFAMIRDRVKTGKKVNEKKKADDDESTKTVEKN
jgi:transcriptional regulator with XRE-family HTH domain